MINWLNEEVQVYEGIFNSKFFHNDEDDRLFIQIVEIPNVKNVLKSL